MKTKIILLLFILLICLQIEGQKQKFKYRDIVSMGNILLTKNIPSIQKWVSDEEYLFEDKTTQVIIKVNVNTNEKFVFADYKKIDEKLPEGFSADRAVFQSGDYNVFLFNENNNVQYFSFAENKFIQITNDDDVEKNPALSPDAQFTAFTKNNNLYCFDIINNKEIQITNDGSAVIFNGYSSWVYWEEIFGRASKYKAYWWSSNSKMIAFMRFDDSNVTSFPLVTYNDIHGKIEWQRYPKAGDPNPAVKLGVYHIESGMTVWIDIEENADHYIAFPTWSADSKTLLYQWENRGQDNVKIFSADPYTGKSKEIYDETQNAWVNIFPDLYILNDNSGFILRTDKSGWHNLYYYDYNGNLLAELTKEKIYISEINYVDEINKVLYFHAHGDPSTDKHFYKVNLDGSGLTKLTDEPGIHSCKVSLQSSFFIDEYSTITQPKIQNVCDTLGNILHEIANAQGEDFEKYDLGTHEIFYIPTTDGLHLPAEWILPSDFDENKKYPVVLSVYGGPERMTVTNSFPFFKSGYYYANNNIIYMDVDNRASFHFSKDIISQVHRNLGRVEIDDLITAAKWLKSLPFIDSTKIGITGSSYGGYTTLMALTRGSDYFNYGIADFSVTDWKLYDTYYTERYMDKPDENPEGYEFGSVINHIEKYKGGLLINHSTMDDNCHYQNTLQVIDKLTDLNKDFKLMIYPNARHGIRFPKLLHANREKTKFWFKNLLGKDFNPESD